MSHEEEKIIICSGKSASLSLDSALTVAWKRRHDSARVKYEEAQRLIDEANAEMGAMVE